MVMFSKWSAAACVAIIAVTLCASQMSMSECKEKAASGDAEAMWQLGQRYEKGDGVRKDSLKAVSQYRKAAERGHSEACTRLAELYETGKIVGKDSVKAARYRAMANGDSGDLAAAKAQAEQDKAKIDHIETALDYLVGRNGQARDAKKGITLLYNIAKDNPTAQRVFVRRWENGDLDEVLNMLSGEEWQLVLPWFLNAYEKGFKAAGQILGLDEYRKARECKEGDGDRRMKSHYLQAVKYWRQSNRAKCWYFIGQFYNPLVSCENYEISSPEYMKDESKAMSAYENCIQQDECHEDARWKLGILCQTAKRKENVNLGKAMEQFKWLLKFKPKDPGYNFMYGLTGYFIEEDRFNGNSRKKLESLVTQIRCNEAYVSNNQGRIVAGPEGDMLMLAYKNLQSQRKEYDNLIIQKTNRQKPYLDCVRKAAKMGFKPAQDFLVKLKGQGT